MKLHCIRTNCVTGEESEETHKAIAFIANFDRKVWIKLEPGVTGYESASKADLLKTHFNGGWTACAGTEGSWDKLLVLPDEMERLRDALRLIPDPITEPA